MVGAITRGTHGQNLKFLKSAMQKGYYCSCTSTDQSPRTSTELKRRRSPNEREETGHDNPAVVAWWIPDPRTGIYYPEGQERVMESIPVGAAKSMEVHCFSYKYSNSVAHAVSFRTAGRVGPRSLRVPHRTRFFTWHVIVGRGAEGISAPCKKPKENIESCLA
ncbi:hypothetical protein H6P81_020597 [Aristolochia fimbriata]|uniref:Uncharacterized protein n=1 Tax=Aristolochia fimbriata TaxID=158543 RepID=A0AAV7DY41_ARIFI|nr:hypothetical protein H6P81_020597 [Aristolochia fimbriata]